MEHMDQNEELYRAWIGTKNQDKYYQKMHNGGFSVLAFFFSDFVLIGRKMFLESIVYLLLVYLIITVLGIIMVPSLIYSAISLLLSLTLGFTYYYLYRSNIKRKIEKYKRKGLSYEEQLEVARKQGGGNVTFGVIIMLIVELVLASALYFGMIKILSIVHPDEYKLTNKGYLNIVKENNVGNNTNSDVITDYDYNNDDNNNDDNNNDDDYITQDNTTKNSWTVDSVKLSYNSSDWQETNYNGLSVLKYKNKGNYLAYLSKQAIPGNNGIEIAKSEELRKKMETQVEQQLTSTQGLSVEYSNWNEISNDLYVYKIECKATDSTTGNEGYINYYCYFSNSNMYFFMTTEAETDYSFTYDAENVMETLKDNVLF